MIKHLIHCSIFLSITLSGIQAQSLKMQNCVTNPPELNKMSYEEADQAISSEEDSILSTKIERICPEYITNLVIEIRSAQLNNNNRVLAIYFLGELRPSDTNSIEALIDYIDLKASRFDPKTRFRRWGQYPAEEALIKIGKPVVDPILNHLPKETSELRRQLMCNVLKQVLR
jgi:hypothetical protein